MEKILVVIMVFASISGMIWRMIKTFRGDDGPCCGCHGCGGSCHELAAKEGQRA